MGWQTIQLFCSFYKQGKTPEMWNELLGSFLAGDGIQYSDFLLSTQGLLYGPLPLLHPHFEGSSQDTIYVLEHESCADVW